MTTLAEAIKADRGEMDLSEYLATMGVERGNPSTVLSRILGPGRLELKLAALVKVKASPELAARTLAEGIFDVTGCKVDESTIVVMARGSGDWSGMLARLGATTNRAELAVAMKVWMGLIRGDIAALRPEGALDCINKIACGIEGGDARIAKTSGEVEALSSYFQGMATPEDCQAAACSLLRLADDERGRA